MQTSKPQTPPLGQNISSLYSSTLTKTYESKVNAIIPNGLLTNLNYSLSMQKFNELAESPINFSDPTLMNNILKADQLLKMGGSEDAFRQTISQLLKLKTIDKKEFDKAWCAMLGDLSVLKSRYSSLCQQNKDKNIKIMTGTSFIHMAPIFETLAPEDKDESTKKENPLTLAGLDWYVSYLQKPLTPDEYKAEVELLKEITTDETILKELVEHITVLKEIIANKKLSGKPTVVVLELTSELSLKELKEVQNKADRVALAKKIWSEKHGLLVALYDRKKITAEKDVVTVITEAINQTLANLKEEHRSTITYSSS